MQEFTFHFLEIESEPIDHGKLKKWIHEVIRIEGSQSGYLMFIFCDDDYLFQMNKKFLSHETYTDIITFNYTDEFEGVSGDMYISVDRVRDNAKKFEVDFLHELSRVMVHGVLHLLGYTDESPDDTALMRAKEDYYLSLLS